jgi:iron complex outermembrane recepter protein
MIAVLLLAAAARVSQVDPATAVDAIVVTAPGGDLDNDDAFKLAREDIARRGSPDILDALDRIIPGLSLSAAQGNPWQPNLVYRGFSASPLQGGAQGIAVYVDGVRFNQPFGDTVLFDLLSDIAVDDLMLKDASPVYGLNALGGALVLSTKTGRDAPGSAGSVSGGSFGRAEGGAEAGWIDDGASGYIAFQAAREDGWRAYSPSTLYRGFADFGWDDARSGLHFKLMGADTELTGNGAVPVELLAANRRAVFTFPDITKNRFARFSAHPWVAVDATGRIEASLYGQHLGQRTTNGDLADVESCDDVSNAGLLCDESGKTPLTGVSGAAIADRLGGKGYGFINSTRTRSTAGGALVQFVDDRPDYHMVVGASIDLSTTRFDAQTALGRLTPVREVVRDGPVIDQFDNGPIRPVSVDARTFYGGVFLSDHVSLGGGLTAEIGLRWNAARIILEDRLGTALNGRHHFYRLNPGIEFDWEAAPGMALRAGYSEANRAPTPAELSCADEAAPCSLTNFFVGDPPLHQVVSRTWEVGASGKRGGFDWLLSAYRAANSDDIQLIASAVRGRAYFQNIGHTRRQGVEATLGYRAGGLNVHIGYALTEATFRSPLVLNSPLNPKADADGTIHVARGARLPGIPRHRALLSVDYNDANWRIGGNVQAASGQVFFGDEANLTPDTGAYIVAGAHGSVTLSERLTLFGVVSNLLDARYATFGSFSPTSGIILAEAPGANDSRALGPATPRRWTLGVKTKF